MINKGGRKEVINREEDVAGLREERSVSDDSAVSSHFYI